MIFRDFPWPFRDISVIFCGVSVVQKCSLCIAFASPGHPQETKQSTTHLGAVYCHLANRSSTSPLQNMVTQASHRSLPMLCLSFTSTSLARLNDRSIAAPMTGYHKYGATASRKTGGLDYQNLITSLLL